eukprot:TRINITY_DN15468_c0_g1_i1.p2 TRINITY_DN15468_c0_g1~~TRINITY_DN15468_c0_g1_i1.p2  ORF type:complete len:129 (-),score=33.03 TRINITY_DN15468_c0_g1_i1:328-714(-)
MAIEIPFEAREGVVIDPAPTVRTCVKHFGLKEWGTWIGSAVGSYGYGYYFQQIRPRRIVAPITVGSLTIGLLGGFQLAFTMSFSKLMGYTNKDWIYDKPTMPSTYVLPESYKKVAEAKLAAQAAAKGL